MSNQDHHGHIHPDAGDRRIFLAIAVNVGLTLIQIAGGILAGSLALIADALHNFSDAISLVIAFVARKIARRPANPSMTFGYGRVEIVAALVNYTALIVIGLYLAYEAVSRFIDPPEVDGWLVVGIATVAFLVDALTALLTRIRAVPGISEVHHVHLWQMQEHENAVDAHLVIDDDAWGEADAIKQRTKEMLSHEFNIGHTTLELERSSRACGSVQTYGHAD